MKRRDLLARTAALGVLGVGAGCTGQRTAPGGQSEDDRTTTTTETTTTTTTTEPPTRLDDVAITESGGICGQQNRASVEFRNGTVVVTGALPTSDPCHEPVVVDSSFDRETGRFEVTMAAQATDAEVCQQCLARVEYQLEATFSDGTARSVVVRHGSTSGEKVVAEAENDGDG